jgi:hypothetical protein
MEIKYGNPQMNMKDLKGLKQQKDRRGKVITVSILINGQPIFTRSARNNFEKNSNGETKYIADTGEVVWHKRDMRNGAIELSKKLLDLISCDMDSERKCE